MDRLLTFAGHRDPYVKNREGAVERDGPVLDLLQQRSFDRLVILRTPGAANNADRLAEQAQLRHPDLDIECVDLDLPDPTDYTAILVRLGGYVGRRLQAWTDENLYVSVASGTPHMHAAWVLLVTSGQLPARILHTRPPRFVTPDKPAVEEVDFTGPAFPDVRARIVPRAVPTPPKAVQAACAALGLVGDSPALTDSIERVAQVATAPVPILITGETGTGKELFAQLAHRLSDRPADRLVVINAAQLGGELTDSVLFGHEKGAFTGATTQHRGAFERADRGTLFLDELGELPSETQAKLLRVLENGTYTRLGGTEELSSTARIVAATNADVHAAIERGDFREDLYFRLSTVEVHLPPLRDRREDIPPLALAFADRANQAYGQSKRLSPAALDHLRRASWPGNVRDLRRIVDRAVLLAPADVIEPEHLETTEQAPALALPEPHEGFDVVAYLGDLRDRLYERALELAEGNQSEAARQLGVSAAAVNKYIHERQPTS